ncbi:DsbA family oxidoreductase [Vibrio sp. 1CM24A]|uniref:DsbA family oxidoreductase n=1 Tax=Vibrio sp. 1CM24A TaxID=2929165 RepID=UPI0020BDFCF2|nr:DsbA family oxidoreductase [Vibrio sp. 1CM24A]MCK8083670.1 DsbA family oxidoreductase [Vibrio sp. 1CM24A]
MTNKLKLEIISDVVCPWCIIGYNNLQAAIKELDVADKIEIEWLPFELNPDMPAEGENLRDHVKRKYGSSREDSDRARASIAQKGAEHGFEFNYFEDMRMVNTLEAHVLLDFAKQFGKQTELKLRLFNAFFSEQKDVSDRNVLRNELIAVGLNADEGISWLDKPELKEDVRMQEAVWQQHGVSGVPTMVFNRESAVTGAHPVENYKQILTELLNKQD